jgi:hypothetical protein
MKTLRNFLFLNNKLLEDYLASLMSQAAVSSMDDKKPSRAYLVQLRQKIAEFFSEDDTGPALVVDAIALYR